MAKDMNNNLQTHIAFHLTGSRTGTNLTSIDEPRLVPALLGEYQDLSTLRYDFPLVLVDTPDGGNYVESMSGIIDDLLSKAATGDDGDRIRAHVLRLEAGIRGSVASGARGRLSGLWDSVAGPMSAADELVADSLARARSELIVDGELLDCDVDLTHRILSHAWGITQGQRAKIFNDIVARLILRLSNILKANFEKSREGLSAENLQSSFGTGPMDAFDFETMSRMLGQSASATPIADSRRSRIEELLSVLKSQRFFATPTSADGVYDFTFDDCASALEAYRKRLPQALELARAIAIGELEMAGEYDEARHDLLFESFGSHGLDARYLAMFPEYLVNLNSDRMLVQDQELLFEILCADLPFKVMVQSDDVIEESEVGDGHLAFSLRSRSLASTAMGLTDVFVLQAPSSALLHLRDEIRRGLDHTGPALFSVFSGGSAAQAGTSAYLTAAAALESRVFPAFVYDPSAGDDWASRFSIAANPQPEMDWPVYDFAHQDRECQAVRGQVAFTLVDFVAYDPRQASHFARVPQDEWTDDLVPVTEFVDLSTREKIDEVPSLLMVDPDDSLQRVIVPDRLIRESRRCLSLWHSLQELAGIHNSHAERAVARAEAAFLERSVAVGPTPDGGPVAQQTLAEAAVPAVGEAAVEADEEPERSPDETYIDTERCSTCNECTEINNKMFAYNDNQQAYIQDLAAGTYAQLVEAAESCQVAVIHPGKPQNPNEPGLEELLKRAEVFA
ncbi:MAG: ferredoxin [Candidatus Nanopelagicales bacterium]|nr:ferredoxin [Candidatus Nanopelagicales bacterium]MDZ4249928.1 ferredoxin [Candidatus Nanopelagicales bacterium]